MADMLRKKIVVVTGGAGFIGSHLCRALIAQGHRVISLDNYFTGSADNHVLGVEYRTGHTRDIAMHIPETPDLVFHLGEYSRVEKSFEDPIQLVWDLNIAGTFSVLEFCRVKTSKLVYAGSSTKFADGGIGRAQSPYAWTKATNADLVVNYGQWFNLNYAIAYFYSVYGEGEIANGPYATIIGIFKQEFQQGLPMTVVAPGTQTRAFTHVSDIVSGLLLIAEHGQGDGYGIGQAREYTILEVAKMFSDDIVMLPERQGNRHGSTQDTDKLTALGWRPQVSLEQHVQEFKVSCTRFASVEKRVLVFSTTFHPIEGPAERALMQVMLQMSDVHFDVVTTLTDPTAAQTSFSLKNVTIHRVGRGNRFDKFRLMVDGAKKAKELTKQHRYLFIWSIMASYAALPAVVVRRQIQRTPLLISLADQRLSELSPIFRLIVRFLLRGADQISTSNAEQARGVSRLEPSSSLTRSNRQGDAFANQIRFLYNTVLNKG